MSVSRKSSKSNGRSWLSDMVANTPTLSKKRSANGVDQLFYKNGSGSIRSISHSTPLYPIITGSFTENQFTPSSPSYPIITSTRQRSASLQQKPFQPSNSSLMKASTLKPRKKISARKLYDEESLTISEKSEPRSGKKYSTSTLAPSSQQAVQHPTVTSTLYDSVALDVPSMSQGYKLNKTAHVGHYRKNEQKKKFLDSGCKTLDRNHFSRVRVRLFNLIFILMFKKFRI